MGNTSRSTMEFDADATRVISETQKILAEQRKLKKEMKEVAEAAARGSVEAQKKLEELAKRYGITVERLKQLQQQLNTTSAGVGRFGAGIGQLSYAMDDFITVLNQPGMGLVPALRAAANNMSVVLYAINPMLAIVPSLSIMLGSLAYKFFNAGESEEKMKGASDELIVSLQKQIRELKTLTDARLQLKAITDQEAFAEEMKPLRQERQKIDEEQAKLFKSYRLSLIEQNQGTPMEDVIRQASRDDLRRLEAFRRSMGPSGRTWESAFQDTDQRSATNQQAMNLLQQRREAEIAAQQRDKADRERKERVDSVMAGLKGPMSQYAARARSEGQSPEAIRQQLLASFGGSVAAGDRDLFAKEVDDTIRGAEGAALGLMTGKQKESLTPAQRRLKEIQADLQGLRAQELEAASATRSPYRRGKIAREFNQRSGPLEAESARIQAEISKDSLSGLETKTETSNELLRKLIGAVESLQPATPSTRRSVARNP